MRLVHVALLDSPILNHFNRLEVNPEQIEAQEIRHETLNERDDTSGYVMNMPLGQLTSLIQNVELLREMADIKHQIYEEAVEEGLTEKEAQNVSEEAETVLAREDVKEALSTLQRAAVILEKNTKRSSTVKEESIPGVPSSEDIPLPTQATSPVSGAPTPEVDWTAFDLHHHPAYESDIKSPSPTADRPSRRALYASVKNAADILDRIVAEHPRLAKLLGQAIQLGEFLTRVYVYVEAGATGAALGAAGGPVGSTIGAGIALAAVHGVEGVVCGIGQELGF